MGEGGFLVLVNGTKYNWTRTRQHKYQMNHWEFPESIPAMSSASIEVEWNQGAGAHQNDDKGEVVYRLDGPDFTFQIQARNISQFNLQVKYLNLPLTGHGPGSVSNLGWKHDGHVNFILAGEEGSFTVNVAPSSTNWMQDNLATLGGRTLKKLCLPGSHDAGISEYVNGTTGAGRSNTITQNKTILDQLRCGVRYFDIRPVISGGKFKTGHYSKVAGWWQGGNGQTVDAIISDINTYTSSNHELIILKLSHDLNTDLGAQSYRPFTQTEWNRLFAKLTQINHCVDLSSNPPTDLTTLTLNSLIGQGHAAVLIIVDNSPNGSSLGTWETVSLGTHENKGFFMISQFPLYDVYSETNDLEKMSYDQLTYKMWNLRTGHLGSWQPDTYFLLSWTLTQDWYQVIGSGFGWFDSIIDLANKANPELYRRLLAQCSKQVYPNVLYIDNVDSFDVAALAMCVNWRLTAPL